MNSNHNNKTPLTEHEIQEIELSLLIEAIYCRWGYDFRDYARASLMRRVLRVIEMEHLRSISALQELVLRDAYSMQRFLDSLTVGYTSMFRDPTFYQAFRRVAVPILQEDKSLRIWHVGCASGEEVYSLAILLHEEGLLQRARIYATDVNQRLLDMAHSGVYPLDKMKEYTKHYHASGGKASFSEYYHVSQGLVTMHSELTKNVVWAQHNLVTDSSFNEFHLVLCRNVLFYFNEFLQERIHRLIYDSLKPEGLLVLGHQEILMAPYISDYVSLDRNEKIYKKIH